VYLKSLRSWILRAGLRAICHLLTGPDERAAEELGALLATLDNLPVGPTWTHLLGRVATERRDRCSWLSVVMTSDGSVLDAKVDEDLFPLFSPSSAGVLEGRALVAEETEWGQVVRSLRPTDMGPSGTDQARSSIPSVSHVMANEDPPPSATRPRIFTVSLPTDRDIKDHTLDSL